MAGFYRGGHLNLKDLWDRNGFGVEIFHTTMSLFRFQFLLRCVRFDDFQDRIERRKSDKLAPFREVFEHFITNCQKNYTISEYATIDEQLVAFRGRCSFRIFIPSKPAKYGIKILTLCDAKMWYTYSMEVYVGKQPVGPYEVSNSAKDVVMRLVPSIMGTGRNVTVDNWFCSIPLAIELQKNNLTLVGTLRKNKAELPNQFVNVKTREINSSMFGYGENMTIVSYVPKKNKNVLLLSSMHFDGSIDDST